MNKSERVDREVRQTLALLDNPDALPPDPYFYGRLKAHIDGQKHGTGIIQIILKPAFFIVLITINVGAIAWHNFSHRPQAENSEEQFIELLVSDPRLENDQSDFLSLR